MVRRFSLFAFGVVAVVTLAAGCGDDANGSAAGTTEPPTSAPGGLQGAYTSTSVTGHDLVAGSTVTLTFDNGNLTAQAGCNTLGGSYRVTGSTLRVAGDMQSTMMACPPGYAEQDQWLMQFLTSGPTVALDGTTLTLTSAGVTMVLSAAPTGAAALKGTKWTLDTINEGSTASALPAGVETPTLEFDAAGTRADVFTGCNRGGADTKISGSAIDFGPLALTRMACPGAASQVEASVVAVLDGRVTYRITNRELHLDKGDRGLIYVSR